MDDLAERIWEVSNKFDPYGFPPNDKEDDVKTIEMTLEIEPMAVIDGLLDMLENLED